VSRSNGGEISGEEDGRRDILEIHFMGLDFVEIKTFQEFRKILWTKPNSIGAF
jgi:hypothetical protein